MKDKLNFVKNFVSEHKVAILTTALTVATTVAVAEQYGIRDHNRFLAKKGLLAEYYAPE